MISAGDFRNGITIELEGNVFQIIEFQHVKPGKILRTVVLLKKPSDLPRNVRRHVLIERTCSIYTQTAICTTSWILKTMSRSL